MAYRILTAEARAERADYQDLLSDRGCSCHISPPCSICVHPGNPVNQEGTDECWITLGGSLVRSRNKREGRYGGRTAANHDLHGRKFKMDRHHFRGLDNTAFGGGL